ncbi:hypothetical protein GCM10027452_43000 [Micromonospora halotolerans]
MRTTRPITGPPPVVPGRPRPPGMLPVIGSPPPGARPPHRPTVGHRADAAGPGRTANHDPPAEVFVVAGPVPS